MTAPPARPLWRTFLSFLGPLILANILQSLSGTLNNVYVGHMLGVRALAAVSAFFPSSSSSSPSSSGWGRARRC